MAPYTYVGLALPASTTKLFHYASRYFLFYPSLYLKSRSIIIQLNLNITLEMAKKDINVRPTYGEVLAFLDAKSFLKSFLIIYPITISQLSVMYMDS
jgi:hypothetical protein